VNKLKQIISDTVKEVVSQEPNPHIRDRRARYVRRVFDESYSGERKRERRD